ncbi:MAG: sialidase family protein [Planctomycetota bacterium]
MWISEIKYQDAATRCYLGSPSLVRLPDGRLLATHDYFGPGCPLNHEGEEHLTSVYRSADDGLTWTNLTHVAGAFWSGLFVHRGAVYLLGTSAQYGSVVIRRSTDGGSTWSHPADGRSGLLFRGGPRRQPPNYHCAPVPVLEHGGRLYRAVEDNDPCHWPRGFQAAVISAPVDADLLDAATWTMSDKLPYDPDADPPAWGGAKGAGWLEGNVVVDPVGQLWNVLRVHSEPVLNKAARVRIHDGGQSLAFDPATGFIDLPGGMSKFTIHRDADTGLYWTLSNDMADEPVPVRRNRLSLFASPDLVRWERRKVLMVDCYENTPEESVRRTGFQYVDWQFDGEDILYVVRVAYIGAHNFHDANRIVFSRVERFRSL